MKSDQGPAIRVENLSKMYKIYASPIDMLYEVFSHKKRHKEFWALKDLTFELRRGEMVGFMGRNGAGKSTLLKILAGTLDRTEGDVQVNGLVSSILELGTGFHPEYTGRENIRMGGLCLGMARKQIEEKIEWIIDFSELRDVIDQPFKTYSTGMQARLTFSTAVCTEPEILMVDEALSVGDVKFQVKCFDKLRDFRSKNGTILFVSHDINTINTFCDRSFLLDHGRIIEEGDPKYVSGCYYRMLFGTNGRVAMSSNCAEQSVPPSEGLVVGESPAADSGEGIADQAESFFVPDSKRPEAATESYAMKFGTGKAEVLDFGILDQNGLKVERLLAQGKYTFFLRALFHENLDTYSIGFLIRDKRGVDVFGASLASMRIPVTPASKGEVVDCLMETEMWLTNGVYLLSAGIAENDDSMCDLRHNALLFEVEWNNAIFPTSIVDLNAKLYLKAADGAMYSSPTR